MGQSIDEWVSERGFEKFRQDVMTHIECTTSATKEEIESATRCIMISLRQELEERKI